MYIFTVLFYLKQPFSIFTYFYCCIFYISCFLFLVEKLSLQYAQFSYDKAASFQNRLHLTR
jgi:hypothetical protein